MRLPARMSVPRIIADRAEGAPESIAVVCGSETSTYREFDLLANQIASYLRRAGVVPGGRVGVALRRRLWLPAALIGVMRAGAAIVPLPLEESWSVVAGLREFASCQAIVCDVETIDDVGPGIGAPILLDHHLREIVATDGPLPQRVVRETDDAYVVFTSGTTGRPKGVVVQHGALANAVVALGALLRLEAGGRMAHHTPLTFDIAAFEILSPLVNGATLLLCEGDLRHNPRLLVNELVDPALTAIHATPAGWRILLELGWRHQRVKVWCGGEALRPGLNRALHRRAAEVWHVYGPSETTLDSTARRTTPDDNPLTVGWPIANTDVFIVNEHGSVCQIGELGEVVIAGAGVARGYLNDAEATQRRFVRAPVTGDRAYATGDIGMITADGELILAGRRDLEVKIAGRRVNPAELEVAIDGWPGVRDGAVITRTLAGRHRLEAFVVPHAGAHPDLGGLARHLEESVPGLSEPIAIRVIGALPLSANGKLDRDALPATEWRSTGAGRPTDPREHRLLEVWREMLEQPSAGTQDDFFDLGGDSLVSILIAAQVREHGIVVQPTDILRLRTVSAIGAALRATERSAGGHTAGGPGVA